MKYKPYTLNNYKDLPPISRLSESQIRDIEVVTNVFPFRTNNYIVDNLIDWDNFSDDPVFLLNFPQREMLSEEHYEEIADLLNRADVTKERIVETSNRIRMQLNPHPAGQMEYNTPTLDGARLKGIQHKYKETVLFFPSQGQLCNAFCTFCFRWPQFVGINELKIASNETAPLIEYLRRNKEVTDLLITGGDPLTMTANRLEGYIEPVLKAGLDHVINIRIGTKVLAHWPYRFLTDNDSGQLLHLFRKIVRSGKQLAFMAHFNHPVELTTNEVKEAISKVRETGAQIRAQAPLLRRINDDFEIWVRMLKEQVRLGIVPYYMFVVRDTGAQRFFGIPLVRAWEIFREMYMRLPGLARTIRGPSMSTTYGKIHVLGVSEIGDRKLLSLQMIQARNPEWVMRPFFAEYNEDALWLEGLKPAFGVEKFFFEQNQ